MAELSEKRIVIAGGSGFLGRSMTQYFTDQGATVTILSRSKPMMPGNWSHCQWNARTLGAWSEVLNGAHAVVNLVGRTVDCIKTPDHRDEILRSRIESTAVLGQAMRAVAHPPPTCVQMSTAHIYGDPPSLLCTESSAEGIGFAPDIARAWEQTFAHSKLPSQRGVIMRTSFVVGRDRGAGSGALAGLGLLAKLGLGGRVGSGTQGLSWIHETDLNRLFAESITNERMSGVYIASSPNPLAQVDFMRTLRRVLRMPIGLPAAGWMVRIGAPLFLRTDPELALYGRYVVSERLEAAGFVFEYSQLEEALREIYRAS